jgi:hypothetical protein
MADATADSWNLSPSEAGAVLAERATDFAAPVPSAERIQDAYDARLRLTALTNDPAWAKRFMEGSIPERLEFEALTQAIADESQAQGDSFVQAPIELTVGDQSTRRQDLIAEINHLAKVGIPSEGIERILLGDFSAQDVEWAQGLLDKGMATKEWTDALMRGDPVIVHEWTALCAVVSAGKLI